MSRAAGSPLLRSSTSCVTCFHPTATAMPSPMMNSAPRPNQSGSSTIDHGQVMTPTSLRTISGNCTPPSVMRHRGRSTDTRTPDIPLRIDAPATRGLASGALIFTAGAVLDGGALAERAAAQFRLLDLRRHVCLVEGTDVGSGRDDLIDPVEDIVGKDDVQPREKIVQLLHGADTEQRARDTRMRDRECHRKVGHRQSRFFGERDQPLHRVQAPLITERRHEFRASNVAILPAPDPAGEHALTEWSPDKNAHAVLLRDRKDLTLDAAVQDRVRRLVGTEPLQAAPFRHPVRLYEVRGRHRRGSERT